MYNKTEERLEEGESFFLEFVASGMFSMLQWMYGKRRKLYFLNILKQHFVGDIMEFAIDKQAFKFM